jgi:hypothetical protein
MAYIWNPTTSYRYSLKKGMAGFDVAALQVNLHVEVDGAYGRLTKKAVNHFQLAADLEVDGVAGLATQEALCVKLSTPAARTEELPVGLLKSIMSNESGFAVGAVSKHPSDAGLDIGAYQRSSGAGPGSQDFYRYAFDIRSSAYTTATEVRGRHDSLPLPVPSRYLTEMANGDTDRFKWVLSTLNHNWPVAAQNIPRYGSIYRYEPQRDDQPAEWIILASGGRLSTPREWVSAYVLNATKFVEW